MTSTSPAAALLFILLLSAPASGQGGTAAPAEPQSSQPPGASAPRTSPAAAAELPGLRSYSSAAAQARLVVQSVAGQLNRDLLLQGNFARTPLVLEARAVGAEDLLLALAVGLQAEWRQAGDYLVLTDAPGLEVYAAASEEHRRGKRSRAEGARPPFSREQLDFILSGRKLPTTAMTLAQQEWARAAIYSLYVGGRLHPTALLPGRCYLATHAMEPGDRAKLTKPPDVGFYGPTRQRHSQTPIFQIEARHLVQPAGDRTAVRVRGQLLRLPPALSGRSPRPKEVGLWTPAADERTRVDVGFPEAKATVAEIIRQVGKKSGLNLLAATHLASRTVPLPGKSVRADKLLDLVSTYTGSDREWLQVKNILVLAVDAELELDASELESGFWESLCALSDVANRVRARVQGALKKKFDREKRLDARDLPKDFQSEALTLSRMIYVRIPDASPTMLTRPDFAIVMGRMTGPSYLTEAQKTPFLVEMPFTDGSRLVYDTDAQRRFNPPPRGTVLEFEYSTRAPSG